MRSIKIPDKDGNEYYGKLYPSPLGGMRFWFNNRIDMTPFRVQRKRTKGWRMPANTCYVGRPSYWGNSFNMKNYSRGDAINFYRMSISKWFAEEIRGSLRGKNLACWCPLDQPCHADILLKIANS